MRVKKKAVAGGLLLLVFMVSLLLMSSQNQNVSEQPVHVGVESQVMELQERVRRAENKAKEREDEILNLRTQMLESARSKNGNNSNLDETAFVSGMTNNMDGILTPGIHSYLPHLTGHPEHLKPATKLSKGRHGVSIVIGVPTIKRAKASYLSKTLTSLITGLNEQEAQDCVIVLFIAEPWDKTYTESIVKLVTDGYKQYLDSGLLEVIVPPAGFYPDLNNLKETFGDSKDRVKWRTKQNLDYAFLMLYSRPKAMYYLQMEDDVISKPGYLTIMKTFASQQKEDWIMLEFSALGFIGKMFKSTDVNVLVEFFLMFHADKPIDWLLDHLLWVKVCNPEKDVKHCQRMIHDVRRRFKPSLFQHIGVESSLKGKVQKLKDRDFGKAGLYRAHVNPPVQIASSLKTYSKFTLTKAYTGETFFWASNPTINDIIDFKFNPPIQVDMYLFRSGNMDHPGDVFHNTTIEVKPVKVPDVELLKGLASRGGLLATEIEHCSEGFYPIGRFNDLGLAQGEMPDWMGQVEVLRIHVHDKFNAWVILSEIQIKETKR